MCFCEGYLQGGSVTLVESDQNNNGKLDENELNELTKAQIAELAKELGYEGIDTADTKAYMIEKFLEAQNG